MATPAYNIEPLPYLGFKVVLFVEYLLLQFVVMKVTRAQRLWLLSRGGH